ncbi:hypothetical protein N0V90_004838 [Kalmusia sp. IMI 367209]|nr:hypothetical protein N0V90_004838 [Kalmusia sp. IMI 367209]
MSEYINTGGRISDDSTIPRVSSNRKHLAASDLSIHELSDMDERAQDKSATESTQLVQDSSVQDPVAVRAKRVTRLSKSLWPFDLLLCLTPILFLGCQSLFTAFTTQIGLRHFDILGASLLVVWLLSPLGGQASLRLLSIQPREFSFNSTLLYYPVEAYSTAPMILSGSNTFQYWPFYASPYMTALQTSKQTINSSMDLWGNIKIPDIKSLPDYKPNNTDAPWYEVRNNSDVVYASLLGTPLIGLPESGNTSFDMTSFYWSVDCSAAKIDPVGPWKQAPNYNTTCPSPQSVWTFDLQINSTIAKDTAYFTYQSRKSDNLAQTNSSSTACRATAPVVQLRVECVNRNCGVHAMREIKRAHVFSPQRWPSSLFLQTAHLIRADLGATQGRPRQSQMTEFFIAGWEDKITRQGEGWVEIADVPAKRLSNRLQMAINTFWDASIGNAFRTGNFSVEEPPSVCPLDEGGSCAAQGFTWNATMLEGRRFGGERYVCNVKFAVIAFVISSLLLGAAVGSVVLGFLVAVPDTFGYVSTSARDNPYFGKYVPGYLDGLEASRLLRDVKVMVGDVDKTAEVGHVAFASMDVQPGRLDARKLYK